MLMKWVELNLNLWIHEYLLYWRLGVAHLFSQLHIRTFNKSIKNGKDKNWLKHVRTLL